MEVVVTGLGVVSALGEKTALWQNLLVGRSAISLRQPFPKLPPRPLAMLSAHPADLTDLLCRATAAAVEDAGLPQRLPDCGVVIGSSRGYQTRWESFLAHHPKFPDSIDDWLGSLPHMGAIAVARHIGSGGPVLAPMAACATAVWAIAQGAHLIRSGQCEQVLVGAGEAPITPLALTGFEQMRALAATGCYPFDRQRQGLALGEGAAVLVLESSHSAQARSAIAYGQVLAAGLTADANHVTAPDEASSQGGIAAIETCLHHSDLTAEDIDFIHAHGTGTHLNDAYETALIQKLFPSTVWVTTTKGATGHTLGASGAIGAAIGLMALRHQTLPPCVGLQTPAFPLRFVHTAQRASLDYGLCFSFGFGGQNAVIALGQRPAPP